MKNWFEISDPYWIILLMKRTFSFLAASPIYCFTGNNPLKGLLIALTTRSSVTPLFSMIVLRIRSTQKPQYSKTAVLKIRSTQKPQYLKYTCYEKIFFTTNVDNCLNFPYHPSKKLLPPLC